MRAYNIYEVISFNRYNFDAFRSISYNICEVVSFESGLETDITEFDVGALPTRIARHTLSSAIHLIESFCPE